MPSAITDGMATQEAARVEVKRTDTDAGFMGPPVENALKGPLALGAEGE